VEHALTEKSNTRASIAHPFNQLQLVDMALNDSVARRQSQTSLDCFFVLYDPGYKALQLTYPAGFDA
jgi:hypothetical protein